MTDKVLSKVTHGFQNCNACGRMILPALQFFRVNAGQIQEFQNSDTYSLEPGNYMLRTCPECRFEWIEEALNNDGEVRPGLTRTDGSS